jgi:transcription-repair coupling factor (superfamily II helicase)
MRDYSSDEPVVVPITLLARKHTRTFSERFRSLPAHIRLISGLHQLPRPIFAARCFCE